MKKKSNLKLYLSAYLPVLLWAGMIFVFSSQPVLPSFVQSTPDFIFKKSAHVFVYFVLFFLSQRALIITNRKNGELDHKKEIKYSYIAIIFCLIYALSDEYHQSFVSGRGASLRDVGFDMLGVALAFLGYYGYI